MTGSTKYIGMDVHKESISIAVMNAAGKIVMECVIETKASMILQFIDGLRGDLQVTFEEGTSAAWLYDLLKPHVTKLLVCDPRKNKSMREGNQNDKIDARRLAELLRIDHLTPVYHGEHGLRTLKELVRSYLTVTKDLGRVMTRVKAIYRSWGIACTGKQVYEPRHRGEWVAKISEGCRLPRIYELSSTSSRTSFHLDITSLRGIACFCTDERSNSTTRNRIEVAQCRSKGENCEVLANNEASFEMLSACRKTHSTKGIGPSRRGTRFELGCRRRRIGPEC